MNSKGVNIYSLALPDARPPTSSSYWVVPGLLLAGAYPGDPASGEHQAKVQSLLGAGIRTFVNLMEYRCERPFKSGGVCVLGPAL